MENDPLKNTDQYIKLLIEEKDGWKREATKQMKINAEKTQTIIELKEENYKLKTNFRVGVFLSIFSLCMSIISIIFACHQTS